MVGLWTSQKWRNEMENYNENKNCQLFTYCEEVIYIYKDFRNIWEAFIKENTNLK